MLDRLRHHRHNEDVKVIKIIVRDSHEEGHQMATPQEMAQQLITDAQTLEAALSGSGSSPADAVLAAVVSAVNTAGLVAVFGADALQSALEADGYTVTAPAAPSA